MSKRARPDSHQEPVVARLRVRYAKRGRLRFTSHRDFARALERAIRRAAVPIAYSAGFSPHPKISYASAAPTGVASEAEYLELGLQAQMSPDEVHSALDAALPPGLDVLEVVPAHGADFAGRITASRWRIELPGVAGGVARDAVRAFLAADEILVQRMTKSGRRTMDARSPVVDMSVTESAVEPATAGGEVGNTTGDPSLGGGIPPCAILNLVVRHVTPSVRPDDVLAGLHVVAALEPPVVPKVTRLAQGTLTGHSEILDPFVADRDRAVTGTPST